MNKSFINANHLQRQSFALAKQILESNYCPTFVIGVWRGGAPIAITVHEVLAFCDIATDHISVRVSSYQGIDQRAGQIEIQDLNYVKKNISQDDNVLIVDDVHETGLSMAKLLEEITNATNPKEIKIATVYYKPTKNQVDFKPDFYVQETKDWLVFPHELIGLSKEELEAKKPGIDALQSLLRDKPHR